MSEHDDERKDRKMAKRTVYWIDGEGNRITILRLPIHRAKLPVPGPVKRPDGSVVFVYPSEGAA